MPTCADCKWGEKAFDEKYHYFLCKAFVNEIEIIEECIAMDENSSCDLYVEKLDDNKTENSSS